MLSQIFILSLRGDAIITKDYRHDVSRASHDVFFRNYKLGEGRKEVAPVFHIDGVNYYHIKAGGLLLCATSKDNLSSSYVLELLQRIGKVIKDYCGVLSEDSLRKNFVLVYELLDEMVDFGYGQSTSTEALKVAIHNQPVAAPQPITQLLRHGTFGDSRAPPAAVNRSVIQRPGDGAGGRGPKRSEIFVDVKEKLVVTINAGGYVLTSEIDGAIVCKSFLSGRPQIKLALNEDLAVGRSEALALAGEYEGGRVVLDDCNFHESVQLDSFETERMLVLTPPEGEFVAMNYRTSSEFRPPFRVTAQVDETAPYKVEVVLKLVADFPAANAASSVQVQVPLPKSTSHVSISTSGAPGQTAEYNEDSKALVWTFRKVHGGSDHLLRAKVALTQERQSNVRKEIGPVNINFSIPMYNLSRLQVRYLQIVQKAKDETPFRWVRYITESSSYVCRI